MPKIDTDTDEGKAEIQKMVDAEVKALKDKNTELLASQKDLKDKMKTFQQQIDEINAEKEKALEDVLNKGGDIEKIKKSLEEKHKRETEKLTGEIANLKKGLNDHLVEGGLTDALAKANVAPQFLDAAKALLRGSIEIKDQDGKSVATVGGKALGDHITEWAQSESGKHFIAAQHNSGGAAKGSNGNGKAVIEKQMKQSEFNALTAKERAATMAEGKTEIISD